MKIIIANSDVGALLKAADSVLAKYEKSVIPENVKGQAVLSVLKNLSQRKDYFDVCAVRSLADMNEVIISAEHMEFYRSMHCIPWADMHQDTREYLMASLVDYFRGNIAMANTKTNEKSPHLD